ncbi:MAG: hypothetical protein DI622_13100 [Chryseobacterium sp.]|nr:MAG: hypothetical protein DI622_13100 [Chryseobacterium sp.]
MKIILIQVLIVLILLLQPFAPIINFIVGYILLIAGCRYFNPLNPLLWLYLAWNILFINAFCGVLQFSNTIDCTKAVSICVGLIGIFILGYYFSMYRLSFKKNNNTKDKFKTFLSSINLFKTEKYTKVFSIFSIVAAFLLTVEIVLIYGGNLLAPNSLRDMYNTREATIFSQLAGIFYFGGLFSTPSFLFLKKSKYRILFIIGILSFAFGSVLTAGRQMVFQLIISFLLCYSVLRYYKIKLALSKTHKYIFVSFISLIMGYFVFISTERSSSIDNRTKLQIYESQNSLNYSNDFISTMNDLPMAVENFFVDYTFYFSHEIFMLSEYLERDKTQLIDFKILRFSPFIERQLDRFGFFGQTQAERLENYQHEFNYGSTIISAGWPSTVAPLLENLGYLGAAFLVFLHGFYSYSIYYKTKSTPSFGYLNLSIANNIIIFNIISNSAFSETQVLFYILVSIYLIRKKI